MYFNWYTIVFRVDMLILLGQLMVTQVCVTIHRERADTEEKCERT